MELKSIAAVAIFLATVLLSVTAASAIPVPPHQFYGSAQIDGMPIDDGYTIDAQIDSVSYSTCISGSGTYGYAPELLKVKADDPMTGDKEGGTNGETVEFYIGTVKASEDFVFADSSLTELTLHFESVCGDAVCMGNETSSNCADCGAPPATPQCDDGLDNDGDGDIDFPADTDCSSAADNSEATPAPPAPSSGSSSKKSTGGGGGGAVEEEDDEVEDTVADKEDMSIKPSDGEAVTGSAIGVFSQQTAVIIVAVLIVAGIGYLYLLRH